jgi:galactarate dehydratase
MVDDILQVAERHLAKLNARQRETCPASELVVGMQCGGSDAFSGVTANPAVGYARSAGPLRRHRHVSLR